MILIPILVVASMAAAALVVLNHPAFGRYPRGARRTRIEHSPNFRDGRFRNLQPTPRITSDRGFAASLLKLFFGRYPRLRPEGAMPAVRTDLHALDRREEVLVWLGHSTYLLQSGGRRFLFDPVLTDRWPMSWMFRPFRGSDGFAPEDIPEVDCLVITHDHWDHLDYRTVRALRERIGTVVCGLGVGEHFEYWGFDPRRIVELDWDEAVDLGGGCSLRCLPARHFSGRSLRRDPTLWASYLVQTPARRIYFSGDGGYGGHFARIGGRFGPIDLAVLENGQYDEDWRYIHLMPARLEQAVADLQAGRVVTGHHAKYALARHPWDEPLELASKAAERCGFELLTPRIGEPVRLADTAQRFEAWWRRVR